MVIKPLSSAIRDGDMIRAVIRATGSNSDGHTPSMTQPSAQAQEKLIRSVYRKAALDFESTRYFEAHGMLALKLDSMKRSFSVAHNPSPLDESSLLSYSRNWNPGW